MPTFFAVFIALPALFALAMAIAVPEALQYAGPLVMLLLAIGMIPLVLAGLGRRSAEFAVTDRR